MEKRSYLHSKIHHLWRYTFLFVLFELAIFNFFRSKINWRQQTEWNIENYCTVWKVTHIYIYQQYIHTHELYGRAIKKKKFEEKKKKTERRSQHRNKMINVYELLNQSYWVYVHSLYWIQWAIDCANNFTYNNRSILFHILEYIWLRMHILLEKFWRLEKITKKQKQNKIHKTFKHISSEGYQGNDGTLCL